MILELKRKICWDILTKTAVGNNIPQGDIKALTGSSLSEDFEREIIYARKGKKIPPRLKRMSEEEIYKMAHLFYVSYLRAGIKKGTFDMFLKRISYAAYISGLRGDKLSNEFTKDITRDVLDSIFGIE